ncbi:MAG TPA: RNA polymerase sigma factor [Candidatus Paceibacterota bacterium]|nr:RNA polymerase sigma factor [Candidatus Paceibacterota bacterium]HOK94447.1 RNA polymerase sigma factor [Candidatus Pacearchaeota archaeon]HPQ23093.1 RNA polymerase sigma factor [Candidatus Paceibacterota bacterium]
MANSLNKKTDEEIVSMIQLGKIELFDILFERYEEKISRYAKKFLLDYDDIEDLVQQVFIKAYINIKSFDASRKFSSWIYRIAHNEFINAIRKKEKEPLPFFDLDALFPSTVSKNDIDKKIQEKELHSLLEKHLNKLNPKYREPLILYYFECLSYKEIADVLHIPTSTVGVRIKRGIESIKKTLQKSDYQIWQVKQPINHQKVLKKNLLL